jgi:acetoacetyl-CoA reductase
LCSQIHIFKLNVTNNKECQSVINSIIEKFKRIDILINNAGILDNQLFHKMTYNQWSNIIDTNLNSLYNVTHYVIQNMIENNNGKIINISSICGLKGSKGQTNYSSSKHGTIGFTKSLALEYGDKNISVNCICPGLVDTDMVRKINEKITSKIINNNPIKKVIPPIEIAKACEFFINSDYCSGTILNLDCGMNC